MQVFCKESSSGMGGILTLQVASSDTIREVKAKIAAAQPRGQSGPCTCSMRLQYGQHTELADGRSLADYSIQQWSTLDLRVSRGRCLPACAAADAGDGDGAGAAEAMPATLPILFQDEHFVAVSKPAGLLVHTTPEARGATDTVLRRLEAQLGLPKLWPVHRLDRGTSGALVLALSSAAAAALSAQWQQCPDDAGDGVESAVADGAVSKEYLALVAGTTAEAFESKEPLTNRRIQTKAARRKKKRDRAEAADHSSGGVFDLEAIPDLAKRRYVAALVALCEQAGGSATVAALAEQCRAEEFGLPAGTGLRATVSEWPKLWAIRQEERAGEAGKVRVVRLLRALKGQAADTGEEAVGTQHPSKRQRSEREHEEWAQKSDQQDQSQGEQQHAGQVDDARGAAAGAAPSLERQAAHTIFRRLAASHTVPSSGEPGEQPEPLALSLLVASLKTGRRHQIRRHLSKLRTPIVGDAEHGMGKVNIYVYDDIYAELCCIQ